MGEYENENGFCRGGAENENDEVVADPENEKSERDTATRAGGDLVEVGSRRCEARRARGRGTDRRLTTVEQPPPSRLRPSSFFFHFPR